MVSHSRWRSPWGMFLYVLLAIPLYAALHLGNMSQEDCFPVRYDDIVHSTWTPSPPDQTADITIYQQFCTTNLTANFTQVTWTRSPHSLSESKGRYSIPPLHPRVNGDRLCVNASITLYNISGDIDAGNYKTEVFTDCASDSMTFQMTVSVCGLKDIPRPTEPPQKPVIVSEHNRTKPVCLSFKFFGNNQITDYRFHLTKNSVTLCEESDSSDKSSSSDSPHFSCYRTIENECNSTFYVKISNYTHQDSGVFCVAAYSTGSNSTGNTSCVELDIQRSGGWPLQTSLGVGFGVGVAAVLVLVAVFIVYRKQKRKRQMTPSHQVETHTADDGGVTEHSHLLHEGSGSANEHQGTQSVSGVADGDIEHDSPRYSDRNSSTPVAQNSVTPLLWQQIPDGSPPLNERQLQRAAEQLTEWKPLARILGLDEPAINAIEHDNPNNKGEQRYRMLYKWLQMKGQGATLKTLIQCVEENFKNRALALSIYNAVSKS